MSQKLILAVAAALTVGLLPAAGLATTKIGRDLTLGEMVAESTRIVHGEVVSKKAKFENGLIVTDYKVRVTENLKTPKGITVPKELSLTLLGGDLESPPISQHAPGLIHLVEGEEVVLFLTDHKPSHPGVPVPQKDLESSLYRSPAIVGFNEGRFSVFTDVRDGKKKVGRFNTEGMGYSYSDHVYQKMLATVANSGVGYTSGPVVKLDDDLYTTPDGKRLLDRTARALAEKDAQAKDAQEARTKGQRPPPNNTRDPNAPLQVQMFDDFRDEIRKAVTKQAQ